jgi:carboxy-cis,cis-muconate cyclase
MVSLVAAAAALSTLAAAAKHHMFVGSYAGTAIHGITFDDTSPTLLVEPLSTGSRPAPERLALSYNGRTLYGTSSAGWSSYDVPAPGRLSTEAAGSASAPPAPGCSAPTSRGGGGGGGGGGIVASGRRPHGVYAALACANSVGVDAASGRLRAPAALVPYGATNTANGSSSSGGQVEVAGLALDPAGRTLYSADWRGGRVWAHAVGADGALAVIGSEGAPSEVAGPAGVVVHPAGKAMYVALASWNSLAHYTIDQGTRMPRYSGEVRSLVPPGVSPLFSEVLRFLMA